MAHALLREQMEPSLLEILQSRWKQAKSIYVPWNGLSHTNASSQHIVPVPLASLQKAAGTGRYMCRLKSGQGNEDSWARRPQCERKLMFHVTRNMGLTQTTSNCFKWSMSVRKCLSLIYMFLEIHNPGCAVLWSISPTIFFYIFFKFIALGALTFWKQEGLLHLEQRGRWIWD